MAKQNKPLRAVWRKMSANQTAPADTDGTVFFVVAEATEPIANIVTNLNGSSPRTKFLHTEVDNLQVVGTENTGGGGGGTSTRDRTGSVEAFLGTLPIWSAPKLVFKPDKRLTVSIVLSSDGKKFQVTYTSLEQPTGTRVFRFRVNGRPYQNSGSWSGKWWPVGEPLSLKLFEVEPGIEPKYWSNKDHGSTDFTAIQLITFKRTN